MSTLRQAVEEYMKYQDRIADDGEYTDDGFYIEFDEQGNMIIGAGATIIIPSKEQ